MYTLKYVVLHFFLMLFAIAQASTQQPSPALDGEDLKIMSYNIHHANPPSIPEKIDIEAIVATIRKENPDLVALQEVDVHTNRSGQIDQAKLIADALGMHYYFAKAIDFDGGEYGQALLSKFPISNPQIHRLPSNTNVRTEPRILVSIDVNIAAEHTITFAGTHLDAQKDATSRELQAAELVRIAKDNTYPMVMAGDLNMTSDQKAFQILSKALRPTCTDCGFTIPVINPKKTIDFIMLRNQDAWEVTAHEVVPEEYASDHLPVTAVLRWIP